MFFFPLTVSFRELIKLWKSSKDLLYSRFYKSTIDLDLDVGDSFMSIYYNHCHLSKVMMMMKKKEAMIIGKEQSPCINSNHVWSLF
jgi:hypothetical protein